MNKIVKFILLFFILSGTSFAQNGNSRCVNTFIGTSNNGATQPGPVVPGGMVSMSPYNVTPHPDHKIHTKGWCSTPYVYENKWVSGFTQINLSGVGCPDYGSLLLMPTSGSVPEDAQHAEKMRKITANPGYFSCLLDYTKVEMTATKRTTRSRYTFQYGQSNVLFDIGGGLSTESGGYARMVSSSEIEGFKIMGDFCYERPQSVIPVYFVVRSSKPTEGMYYWKKARKHEGAVGQWSQYSGTTKLYFDYKRPIAGDDIGVAFCFNTEEDEQIEISVGISFVSIENARLNLNSEQGSADNVKTFETIRTEAAQAWDEVLGVVSIEGGTDDQKTQFYTALYHNWIHPNTLSDVNGEYPQMRNGQTATMRNGEDKLTMFSGWDVYRISPFLGAIFYPERQNSMARSMMQMYRESGSLPKFEIGGQEFAVMEGDPALPYLASCLFLGVTKGIDTQELYDAMMLNAEGETNVREDVEFYNRHHYVPFTKQYDNSVSQALELYIADWSLAQVALHLGKTADYKKLNSRAMGYKKYFDPKYNLLRPVNSDGKFMEGFNPMEGKNFAQVNGFHEGTSWNYSFAIPYDIDGLVKLHGNQRKFTDSLQACLERGQHETSYFDMGNEPNMGYPFIFNHIKGEQWRTQYWVRYCMDRYFGNKPGGLPGNDDAGTMSAWQMFAMMGIYPTCPGKPEYTFTTPVFDRITIKLDPTFYKQPTLTIETVNNSKENIYIEKIEVAGKPHNSYFISHEDLMNAGVVKIHCTNKPKK